MLRTDPVAVLGGLTVVTNGLLSFDGFWKAPLMIRRIEISSLTSLSEPKRGETLHFQVAFPLPTLKSASWLLPRD